MEGGVSQSVGQSVSQSKRSPPYDDACTDAICNLWFSDDAINGTEVDTETR